MIRILWQCICLILTPFRVGDCIEEENTRKVKNMDAAAAMKFAVSGGIASKIDWYEMGFINYCWAFRDGICYLFRKGPKCERKRISPMVVGFCDMFIQFYVSDVQSYIWCWSNTDRGTAYAVWTGIGAVGGVVMGILVFNDPLSFWRIFFIITLIASVVGLKWVSN